MSADFIANWHWPQFTILAMMFITLVVECGNSGKPKVQTAGPDKGQPQDYNGFLGICRFAFWGAILIAGGFFR